MRKLFSFRLLVVVFCLVQLAMGAWVARWCLDWRQAQAALSEQQAVLSKQTSSPSNDISQLVKARDEAQSRLQQATASLPESLKATDVVEHVYLAALASGATLSQVTLSGQSGQGSALRKSTEALVVATVPNTEGLLRFVGELEKGQPPAYVKLPSLQVLAGPTPVTLSVEFWSRKGVETP